MDELGRESTVNGPFLKIITGNDQIRCRKLNKSGSSFKPLFTPFLQCNNLPDIKNIDKGLMRRIKVIKYKFNFVDNPMDENDRKKDDTIKDIFTTVEYAREYLLLLLDTIKEIKNIKILSIPKAVKNETNEYFDDNNPVKNFIDTYLSKVANTKIKTTELKEHFDSKCDIKMSMKSFIKAMVVNGYDTKIVNGYKFFKNIQIRELNEEEKEVEIDM
jgi:phage/plasmid-associated DNA primase